MNPSPRPCSSKVVSPDGLATMLPIPSEEAGVSMDLFDKDGHIVCYVTESGRVYSWGGKPLGTCRDARIYHLSGEFIGWLRYGYLVDPSGDCLLFTPGANSKVGPGLPSRHTRGPKATRQPFPEVGSREPAPHMPPISRRWGESPFGPPEEFPLPASRSVFQRLFAKTNPAG